MSEPFIGEIRMFAGSYAPRDWAFCDGRLVNVAENPELYSLLGTAYGGDGRTTFGLPDLRGRAPMHFGNGPGLTSRRRGDKLGQETVNLQATQLDTGGRTQTTVNEGASTTLPIMQPYTCVNFIIALNGLYPSRP